MQIPFYYYSNWVLIETELENSYKLKLEMEDSLTCRLKFEIMLNANLPKKLKI